ncbi:hypothetical protein ABIF90_004025 [Bradyrhizobium japonicum]
MTQLYFEDAEIGMTSKAGPYLVSKGRDRPVRQAI